MHARIMESDVVYLAISACAWYDIFNISWYTAYKKC